MEWNDEEREALAAIRREVEPDGRLEELTVARLLQEGLIGAAKAPWFLRRWPRLEPTRFGWACAAAALVAAVFFAGVAVGQRWALRSTTEALASFHGDAMMQASARVQQTGSAYVAAIAALGRMAAEGDGEDASQGREAALAALYAAASQLSRLDPNDPLAARILQGLEDVRTTESVGAARERERQVVWF